MHAALNVLFVGMLQISTAFVGLNKTFCLFGNFTYITSVINENSGVTLLASMLLHSVKSAEIRSFLWSVFFGI